MGAPRAKVKYHYFCRSFTYSVKRGKDTYSLIAIRVPYSSCKPGMAAISFTL